MTKVLISDCTHEVLEQRLREAGIEVSVEPGHDYESLIVAAQGCDGLVVRSKVVVDRAFIDRVPSLRCIGRVGAGMETIDVEYAEKLRASTVVKGMRRTGKTFITYARMKRLLDEGRRRKEEVDG